MPLTGIGSAGISAGASLAGGIASTIANAIQNKQNQKFQREETQKAREWQEHMYKTYNSPQAQAHQLASAGINPYNQGGASTTPMSTSTSAPTPATTPYDFSYIGDAADKAVGHIQNASVLKAQSLANQATELDIESKRIQIRRDLMAEIREAIDTGNYEQAATLNLQLISETIQDSKDSRKVKIATRNKLQQEFANLVEDHKEKVRNNRLGDASEAAGVNPFITEDKLKNAQIDKIQQEIDNLAIDEQFKQFTLDTARLFDRAFLNLDLQARQTEVKEFLSTSDERVYMHHVQKELMRLAKNEADRADALSHITNESDKLIAQQILDDLKDGKSSFDGILTKMLSENPVGTLNSIISLAGSLKPEIKNNNYVTNKSTTYKY